MCGRYNFDIDSDIKEVKSIMENISFSNKDIKTGEIFPTENVPILKLSERINEPEINIMSWGLPRWDNKGVIINARGESVRDKAMFKNLIEENRCVILSTGFFEWNQNQAKGKRDKYLFNNKHEDMLYMAGIYNKYDGGENFVILTQDSNNSINDIHHRMPVILKRKELIYWLKEDNYLDYFLNRQDIELERVRVE